MWSVGINRRLEVQSYAGPNESHGIGFCVLPPCFKSLGKSLMDFVLYYLVLRVVESHCRVLSGTVT